MRYNNPMLFRIFPRIVRRRRVHRCRRSSVANQKDYLERKETARDLIMNRLEFFVNEYAKLNPVYTLAMKFGTVSIKNTRSRWGSCSSKKNLNFNYRLLDLSPELRDYVIVHELCHLVELHHGKSFWDLMKVMVPRAYEFHLEVRTKKLD